MRRHSLGFRRMGWKWRELGAISIVLEHSTIVTPWWCWILRRHVHSCGNQDPNSPMSIVSPTNGGFVPLFAFAPPAEELSPSAQDLEVLRQRQAEIELIQARKAGIEAGLAEASRTREIELAALRIEMHESLKAIVESSVRDLEDLARETERRFEQALASLVDAIVGPSGRGVLSAGLVSLLLNTVEALRPPRPLVVTINPEEWKFVSERVPEFETFMRKTGVKVVTCAETAAASATITHSTGEVRVNLGAFVERLASAVDSASARLGRTATVKGES